eukprot:88896-Pleurochrysis_carterae.AAC.3
MRFRLAWRRLRQFYTCYLYPITPILPIGSSARCLDTLLWARTALLLRCAHASSPRPRADADGSEAETAVRETETPPCFRTLRPQDNMPSAGSSRIKVAPAPYRFNAADEQQSLLLSSPSSIRSDGAQPIPAYDGIQSGTRSVLPCADERPVLAPSPLVASSTPTAEQVTTQCSDFGDQVAATKDQVAQAQQLLHIKLGGKLAFGEAVTSILHRVCGLTDLDCKMIADNFAKSGDDWLAHVLSIDLSINAIG